MPSSVGRSAIVCGDSKRLVIGCAFGVIRAQLRLDIREHLQDCGFVVTPSRAMGAGKLHERVIVLRERPAFGFPNVEAQSHEGAEGRAW